VPAGKFPTMPIHNFRGLSATFTNAHEKVGQMKDC